MIQVINKYLILSDDGITQPILCGMNPDHGRLYGSLDDNDVISLFCLGCDYRMMPGVELYERIEKVLSEIFQ